MSLNPALEAALALDPDARRRVERLAGAVLEVRILGPDLSLFVVPDGERVHLAATAPDEPAACIVGPPASLARLLTTDGTRVLFGGPLTVEGDVVVAKSYKRLFDTLDPDWEEALAGWVGDVPAHEAGRVAGAFSIWIQRTLAGRREDLQAWLIDEVEALPARSEVDDWLAEVDRLRADVDRLSARVARLRRSSGEQG